MENLVQNIPVMVALILPVVLALTIVTNIIVEALKGLTYVICPCSPIPISSLTVCKTHLTVNPSRENDPDWRLAVPALTVRYVMHTICPRHPVCRPKPGKSSSGGLLTTSREFHPNCRSDRAAPIA